RRAHERNAAGKRLEYSDRRNAGQLLAIEAAWDVDRRAGGREELGHSKVRDPPAVLQVSPREPLERIGRIAHAVDEAAEPQLTGRTDQEFLELARPLPVSPVADPHEVPGPPLEAERLEYARIGRLVPSPGARGPATPLIELPQHL